MDVEELNREIKVLRVQVAELEAINRAKSAKADYKLDENIAFIDCVDKEIIWLKERYARSGERLQKARENFSRPIITEASHSELLRAVITYFVEEGTAEIFFSRQEDAISAVKIYNNVELDGKPMKIEMGTPVVMHPVAVADNIVWRGRMYGVPRNYCLIISDCEKRLQRALIFVGEIGGNDYNYAFFQGKQVEEISTYVPHVVRSITDTVQLPVYASRMLRSSNGWYWFDEISYMSSGSKTSATEHSTKRILNQKAFSLNVVHLEERHAAPMVGDALCFLFSVGPYPSNCSHSSNNKPGKPIAYLLFKIYGRISTVHAVSFLSDMKLGHYMKIPPRCMFTTQLVGTMIAGTINLSVAWWMLGNVENVGATGKALKDVVAAGIGGSFLGLLFVHTALQTDPEAITCVKGRQLRFLANADPIDVARTIAGLP
ncbi:hypothetical protein GIB67_030499 [Kingdonia uniflora]|uniref:Uncharacterized protein n=1 Tax=Kingdonia uniflora TaxID=39325 RepID=A0A7J7M2F4_9MAGN|nr:hypothetical protein GIB67_030499 [Kingdonia uniflora]